jgi:penicillin amidase
MAREIAPIMARALVAHQDTKTIGEILASWDYDDRADQTAPSIFHSVYRQFALLVYSDDLGDSLARTMLGDWYFWQERLHSMILKNDSPWFDNIKTRDRKETRDELFHVAALNAAIELKSILGDDPVKWDWGRLHRYEFVSPLKRSGPGKGLLGGGSHPAPGSVDTLGRGRYDFNKPYTVTVFDSMRMVVDMGDPDKVLAVIPGGVVGRQFHPHMKDQIKPYLNGDRIYWWFSDKAIKENARDKLALNPR